MIEKLLVQGIEIHAARGDFQADGFVYPAGSYVIFLDQPKYGLIKSLLGRTFYPDNPWTRDEDGTPRRPKDKATDTMPEFMGVRVDPVDCRIEADMEKIAEPLMPEGHVLGKTGRAYALDCRINDSFKAVNRLLALGAKVGRAQGHLDCGDACLSPGSFVIDGVERARLEELASEMHLTFYTLTSDVEAVEIGQAKVGMYQRYYGGNSDEGWTRLVFEQFEFPYKSLMDEDLRGGGLDGLDVIVLPSDREVMITGENLEEWARERGRPLPNYPPEYRSGMGEEGVEALRKFVDDGGTLVCLNASCGFAIKAFGLKVKNALEGLPPKEFFCPGSTLRTHVDDSHPMGYGMPADGLVFFWDSPAFEILPSGDNDKYEIVVRYREKDILRSGWLIGEDKIRNKAAMVVARKGEGKIVLIGFRAQHRAQTHGTYNLLFNSLLI